MNQQQPHGPRQCDDVMVNVLLETLGPAIHMDVHLTRSTHLNSVTSALHGNSIP